MRGFCCWVRNVSLQLGDCEWRSAFAALRVRGYQLRAGRLTRPGTEARAGVSKDRLVHAILSDGCELRVVEIVGAHNAVAVVRANDEGATLSSPTVQLNACDRAVRDEICVRQLVRRNTQSLPEQKHSAEFGDRRRVYIDNEVGRTCDLHPVVAELRGVDGECAESEEETDHHRFAGRATSKPDTNRAAAAYIVARSSYHRSNPYRRDCVQSRVIVSDNLAHGTPSTLTLTVATFSTVRPSDCRYNSCSM